MATNPEKKQKNKQTMHQSLSTDLQFLILL